jgi:hypothetical protein
MRLAGIAPLHISSKSRKEAVPVPLFFARNRRGGALFAWRKTMRIKPAALTLAIASLLILPSFAKADTFEYDYTSGSISSGGITGTVNIVFTLTAPTPPTSGDLDSFTTTTDTFGPVTAFAWYYEGGS